MSLMAISHQSLFRVYMGSSHSSKTQHVYVLKLKSVNVFFLFSFVLIWTARRFLYSNGCIKTHGKPVMESPTSWCHRFVITFI